MMRRTAAALSAALFATTAMADNFTYNIQMAGYAFDQFDEKGTITYERFVQEFRKFPWTSQVGQAKGRSEPTISVRNHSNSTDYWVSAARHGVGHVYLVGIVYAKDKPALFGFGKPKTVRWVEIYVAEAPGTVEETFRTFFAGKQEELLRQLRALPKFDEMEAKR
jgi:hypothetical protein